MADPAGAFSRVNLTGLLTMVMLGGVWEASVRSGLVEYRYLPAPSAVVADAGALIASGDLFDAVIHTLTATLLGWLAASAVGIALGVVLGLSDTAWRYSMSSIEAMKGVPPITLVPVALLVFGFSLRMELVIIIYVGLWPVLINTIGGVRGVEEELLDVARMLKMSSLTEIRKITLPAALPTITVGLRLSLSLCLVLAIVAEMVGNPSGLGNALIRARQALQPNEMFAYVLTTGLLGITLNAGFNQVSSRLLPSVAARRAGAVP